MHTKIIHFVLSDPEESIRLKMESGTMSPTSFLGSVDGPKSLRFISMETEKLISLNRKSQPCLEKQFQKQGDSYHR